MGDGATRAAALSVGKLSCLFWVSSGPPAAPLCLPCCPPHRTVTRSDLSPHPSQATQPRLFHDTVTITEKRLSRYYLHQASRGTYAGIDRDARGQDGSRARAAAELK